jgi:GNAT superfamily N-acetyltransferase
MHALPTQLGDLPLRRCTVDDAGHVFDIMCDAALWLASRGIDQWRTVPTDGFRKFLNKRVAEWPVYLVQHDGKYVATICLQDSDVHTWTEPGDRDTPAGYVHGLATRACVRNAGVGKALLDFAERTFREQGKRRIRLDCLIDNPFLTRYYLAFGYRAVRDLPRTRLFEKAL